jgi:hypothetical protein
MDFNKVSGYASAVERSIARLGNEIVECVTGFMEQGEDFRMGEKARVAFRGLVNVEEDGRSWIRTCAVMLAVTLQRNACQRETE